MARRLKVKKYDVPNVNYQWLGAYRLRIEVSDPSGSGADPYVFLYLRNLPNPYDGSVTDVFHAVASPVDLAEYPIGEPDERTTYPFYRLDYVELDFRSTETAQESYILILEEINNLLLALDRLDLLVAAEETWVGAGAPPDDGSSSSSASASDSVSVSGSIP